MENIVERFTLLWESYGMHLVLGVSIFIAAFSIGYFYYPGDGYSSNFDVQVDADNPEETVSFDGKNATLGYNSSGPEYVKIENRTRRIDLEGRQNDIFAADGEVYMFYFESAGDYLRLLRIERL
ncbi:MAG: hypothetical protein ACLFTA_01890 [Candidatus Nanohaloarchaea archaeon]